MEGLQEAEAAKVVHRPAGLAQNHRPQNSNVKCLSRTVEGNSNISAIRVTELTVTSSAGIFNKAVAMQSIDNLPGG